MVYAMSLTDYTNRCDHEVLEVQRVARVGVAVENVGVRHPKAFYAICLVHNLGVQFEPLLVSKCAGHGD